MKASVERGDRRRTGRILDGLGGVWDRVLEGWTRLGIGVRRSRTLNDMP